MKSDKILTRIMKMEAGLKALKKSILRQPDLTVDGKKWQEVERTTRSARKRTFHKFYGKG